MIIPLSPARLHVPRDGRINGDGFTAKVSGYRFGAQFGTGSSALRAAAGQELLVFGLVTSTSALHASLVVGGRREPLPRRAEATPFVPVYYLASVPERAKDVSLEVSKEGLTQEFSFTHGRREGPQPVVLYDTVTDWEVSQSFTDDAYLSVLGPTGAVRETATQVITISASLTYFLPGTDATPGGPSEAWLVVKGSTFPFYTTAPQDLPDLAYAKPLAGSDITLSLPGRGPKVAKVIPRSGASHGSLFKGGYYWRVPASIASATLHMTMPPLVATSPASGTLTTFRARLSAAPVLLDFPSPSGPFPAPVGNPPPYLGVLHTSSPLAARATGLPLLALLLGFAALVLTGSLVVLRRRGSLSLVWALARSWSGTEPSPGLSGQATGIGDDRTERAPFADEDRVHSPVFGATSTDGPRSSPGASFPLDLGGGLPLPEGTVLHIVGQVRLDRLSQPPELPADAPESPRHVAGSSAAPLPPADTEPTTTSGLHRAASRKVLPSVPDGPPQLPHGAKELQVLGEPRLFSEPAGVVELGWPELELLARLALGSGRAFSSDELRADIGSGKDTDWAPNTLWTRASSLRLLLGADHMPHSQKAGGYKVVGIGTDVVRFEAALAHAKADPGEAARHLTEALSLVRGAPFANVPPGTFGWARDAGGMATRLANATHDAAVQLARTAIAGKDQALAAWAIGKGRVIARDDELLAELERDAAVASLGARPRHVVPGQT